MSSIPVTNLVARTHMPRRRGSLCWGRRQWKREKRRKSERVSLVVCKRVMVRERERVRESYWECARERERERIGFFSVSGPGKSFSLSHSPALTTFRSFSTPASSNNFVWIRLSPSPPAASERKFRRINKKPYQPFGKTTPGSDWKQVFTTTTTRRGGVFGSNEKQK